MIIGHVASSTKAQIKNYLAEFSNDAFDLHKTLLKEVELALIEVVIEHTQGNQITASKLLGLNRNTLRRKIQDYHIDVTKYKS